MKVNNISIFSNADALYLTRADDNLIKITGKNKEILEQIIGSFSQTEDIEEAFLKAGNSVDKGFFLQAVGWLKENQILVNGDRKRQEAQNIKIALYGDFADEAEVSEKLISKLNTEFLDYSLGSFSRSSQNDFSVDTFLKGIDIILLFSPLYNDSEVIDLINRNAYKKNIPVFHAGLDNTTAILGPIVDPSLLTPCIDCYEKRRFSNLDNADGFWNFITIKGKRKIHSANITHNRIFPVFAELISKELSNFWSEGAAFSPLLSRSIKFDLVNYEIIKSKILRVNSCDVCNKQTVYAPFDA
jgi:molybdopterin/thiamine biosynthesis adenylyltransferase